ncbi:MULTISPECIES: endonuclease III [Bifidobacterium]|jgi:endonuclease-3|uniref:Endonuclease III n=1 Tax=Bifidobacterium tibiigranuli TaxID=2172043 RepID=A0A5N6S5T3_9BIFI|nr:endonuclease III [Bifidobacterium tibiigranuli]KAE8129189.1 endonuclease III [Bifidobacterium tibiigranuli]KAE8129427.1 endonuclease III [Bifidobacterium tibiigranuli]MCH3975399.1 endonuclease III [Bifidobacterium tibiigranuli]MCH4189703.1 endonuclease III [Bifidobacterium tibiigranuli]MCH4204242.1 endonuclease III [Bifidobacterium tibiigranuli]
MPRESKRALHARMQEEYALLCEEIPEPKCALDFSTPLQLLIATVLSAQTTDKRVNTVTPILFSEYPSAAELAAASPERVEDIIHPLGFYHSKSAHIIALADQLQERFDGVVPQRMEELVTLPGVGRKTANVVLGNAFGVPGFPVDTHVMRVTGRLRWRSDWRSTHPDPVRIEREITACFPPEEWTDLSHRLILHGRAICHARKPDCANCPLNATCPSSEV